MLFQRKSGQLCGALSDFDLAITKPCSGTSPASPAKILTDAPFIALDLLNEPSAVPRYRHDLESFLYAITWCASRYEGGKEIARAPLDDWGYPAGDAKFAKAKFMFGVFDCKYDRLLPRKARMLVWPLCYFQMTFRDGMLKRKPYEHREQIDEETFGGVVTLSRIAEVINEGIEMIMRDSKLEMTDALINEMREDAKKFGDSRELDKKCLLNLMGMGIRL
ncbi:hypothetical protein SERLADRAFT_453087 [Serpula lacrymans var. lacrymans S7.9]|nr:uncharacterized protein SERLADRAFT_453087 [Serpula lacrymans var. lacrymans S7.9]EGO19748.1 hypothetical protein SERLADRAFT_453087 [Serpula lacrymans var. lacrymans S7.9]